MTKLEVIQNLLLNKEAEEQEIMTPIMLDYSDEKLLRIWNHNDQINNHGIKLIKVNDEFEIEFYAPLCDFFKQAWLNMAA